MANFVLVEHSLKAVGGHHYEYAVHVLRAARQAGFDVVLATHRRFRDYDSLPADWHVRPLFRHDIYCKHASAWSRRTCDAAMADDNSSRRSRPSAWSRWSNPARCLDAVRGFVRKLDRDWRLHCFAASCTKLFRDVTLTPEDHVFVPTLSEFDLRGLVQFLARTPETRIPLWHLQFHFDIFDGRAPEYDNQLEHLDAIRRQFREALALVPGHRFRFYCTTPQMAAQYNRLEVGEFCELPYAINPAFGGTERTAVPNRPLRVTCAGGIRREKGRKQLTEIIRQLWKPYLCAGKLQFFIQADQRRFRQLWPSRVPRLLSGRAPRPACDASRPSPEQPSPLVRVAHPLGTEDYVQFVCAADIGMFLYNDRGYYARFSGILAEMLTAGVPVIVPAGCWLAEQIAEPIGEHLDRLRRIAPIVASYDAGHFQGDAPTTGDRLVFGPAKSAAVGTLAVPSSTAELLIRFRWLQPAAAGTYVRLLAEQYDRQGRRVDQFTTIVGPRRSGGKVSALVYVTPSASTVRLRWENAYSNGPIVLGEAEACFLGSAGTQHRPRPAGAVGLIAAGTDQVGSLLADMVQHYPHYKRTATEFSRQWQENHGPRRTLATLLGMPAGSSAAEVPAKDRRGPLQAETLTFPEEHRRVGPSLDSPDSKRQARAA